VLHDDPVSVCRLTGVPLLRIDDKRERRARAPRGKVFVACARTAHVAIARARGTRRRGERPPERAAGKVSDTR
jgi:hypothetical protein